MKEICCFIFLFSAFLFSVECCQILLGTGNVCFLPKYAEGISQLHQYTGRESVTISLQHLLLISPSSPSSSFPSSTPPSVLGRGQPSSDSDSVTASVIHLQHVTHHARKHKNTHGCTFLNNNIHTHYIIPLVDITQIGAGSIKIFPYVMSGTCTQIHRNKLNYTYDRHLTQNMGFPNTSTFTLCCYYANLNDNTSKGSIFT